MRALCFVWIVFVLLGTLGCAHKKRVFKTGPGPARIQGRQGDLAKIESQVRKLWPADVRYVFTEKEARDWARFIRAAECRKLILGYNGGESGLPGYDWLDITAIIPNGDFGGRLLEYARAHKLHPLQITTFEPQLIAIMLDREDHVIAALTQNDGCCQPVRVGRYRGRWVFDTLFWKRAHRLRFEAQELVKEMRKIAVENGPNQWDEDEE